MTTTLHAAAPLGQIHSPANWTFTTAAARQAVGTYTALQLGCEAMQTDTSPPTFWKLVAVASPGSAATPTWRQITTTADSGSSTPLTIMSGHIVAGYIPETGLTSTAWADQGPNGYNLSGTCTVQTNQINGYSCAKGNGTSNILSRTQALAAPATTPLWRYTVVRIDTYLNNFTISAFGNTNELSVLMHNATDQVSQFSAGSYGNVNAAGCTVGSFKLVKAKFSGSTADSIKAGGGTLVTSTACANTPPTGINLLGSNGGFSAVSVAEDWIFNQDPGTSLDSYLTTKFPGCET